MHICVCVLHINVCIIFITYALYITHTYICMHMCKMHIYTCEYVCVYVY